MTTTDGLTLQIIFIEYFFICLWKPTGHLVDPCWNRVLYLWLKSILFDWSKTSATTYLAHQGIRKVLWFRRRHRCLCRSRHWRQRSSGDRRLRLVALHALRLHRQPPFLLQTQTLLCEKFISYNVRAAMNRYLLEGDPFIVRSHRGARGGGFKCPNFGIEQLWKSERRGAGLKYQKNCERYKWMPPNLYLQ